jgi:hypothetical protein
MAGSSVSATSKDFLKLAKVEQKFSRPSSFQSLKRTLESSTTRNHLQPRKNPYADGRASIERKSHGLQRWIANNKRSFGYKQSPQFSQIFVSSFCSSNTTCLEFLWNNGIHSAKASSRVTNK